jgi:CIC family chloride channel protein
VPWRNELGPVVRRLRGVVLWSAVAGAITGLGVVGIERLVVDLLVDPLLDAPLWVQAVLPTAGLAVAALSLRFVGRDATPTTTDEYLLAFHDRDHDLGARAGLARLAASIATIGSGGALGLEGPSMYLGSSVGAALHGRVARFLGGADRRALLVAGAAAGVGAIFKAPATGAVFALEVPYQDDLARRLLLPALVGSASGYLALVAFNGTAPLFAVRGSPPFSLLDLAGAVGLGLAAGVGARIFAALLRGAKRVGMVTPAVVRVVVAGAAIAGIFAGCRVAAGRSLTFGPGYNTIQWALDPRRTVGVLLAVLALRVLATTATIGGGGVGGLFIPLVVAGAVLGQGLDAAVGHSGTSLFAVIGVAAFLGAGYRVPLAAVMFVAESTGRPGFVVPGLLAAVAAELLMGHASVTSHQVASD